MNNKKINKMNSSEREFKVLNPTTELGIVSPKKNMPSTIKGQSERSPADFYSTKIVLTPEGSVRLNQKIKVRIPRENFVISKHTFVRFNMTAAIAGTANAALLPSFDCLAEGSVVRLLHNNVLVEEITAKQIQFESLMYLSQEERMPIQILQNDDSSTVRTLKIANNTTNKSYYIYLGELLSKHIHLPLSSYEGDWFVEVKFAPLNQMVDGTDAAAAVGTLNEVEIINHGHKVPGKTAEELSVHVRSKNGISHHYYDVTEEVVVIAAGTTSPVFSFPQLRGKVSHVVMFAVENAKYTSTVPNIINKSAFVDLGEGTFSYGTSSVRDKWTLLPQELRMIRYNKGARKSNGIQFDASGAVRDLPYYIWELTQREQLDVNAGTSTGNVDANGKDRIALTLASNPNPNVELRYFFLFYQPMRVVIKGITVNKEFSH